MKLIRFKELTDADLMIMFLMSTTIVNDIILSDAELEHMENIILLDYHSDGLNYTVKFCNEILYSNVDEYIELDDDTSYADVMEYIKNYLIVRYDNVINLIQKQKIDK